MLGLGAPDAISRAPTPILHAEEITSASEQLTVLVMGTNDMVKEVYVDHDPARTNLVTTNLQLAVLTARASGKVILGGVYNDVKDAEAPGRPAVGMLPRLGQIAKLEPVQPGHLPGVSVSLPVANLWPAR